ncbi:MAG TPA: hypothetical protein VE821_12515 [Pyrinomonadaceae bacterium]|nr:hypothetical protein [Pyrinomonadaceae bacterium]
MMNRQAIEVLPLAGLDEHDLTPAEIRGVLFELARGTVDERTARPAIRALNRIMRDSADAPLPKAVE